MSSQQAEWGLRLSEVDELQKSTNQVPPFLFRAFSVERSRGTNNEHEMRPLPAETLPRCSIFAKPYNDVRKMLRAHLLWEYWNPSNFISWTSSILWVLEHAARMHTYEGKSNVHIAVMDTRKIHDMAIFPATALMNVYGIPAADDDKRFKLDKSYYTAEYLFFGPLLNSTFDPCFQAIRWETVCNADLQNCLQVFSGRSASESQLLKRIENLRPFFENTNVTAGSQSILPGIAVVGALFDREFQTVIVIALITMLYGRQTPSVADLRRDINHLRLPRPRDPDSIIRSECRNHIDPSLHEVTRMHNTLAEILRLGLGGRYQDDLAASFGNLTVDGR